MIARFLQSIFLFLLSDGLSTFCCFGWIWQKARPLQRSLRLLNFLETVIRLSRGLKKCFFFVKSFLMGGHYCWKYDLKLIDFVCHLVAILVSSIDSTLSCLWISNLLAAQESSEHLKYLPKTQLCSLTSMIPFYFVLSSLELFLNL